MWHDDIKYSTDEYYNDLANEYIERYNVATIGEAEWETKDKEKVLFKNMEESHILNCISRFKKHETLVGVFRLELFRRKVEKLYERM